VESFYVPILDLKEEQQYDQLKVQQVLPIKLRNWFQNKKRDEVSENYF